MLTEKEKQWLEEREKLCNINGCYSYEFFMMQEEERLLHGFYASYLYYWSQSRKRLASVEANGC
jgi:hypothetical protein